MNDNDYLDDSLPEEERDKFSDDPEEQLRIENELLRLQLMVETGSDFNLFNNVPPEIENIFLNNILTIERSLDSVTTITIYELLGKPDDFPGEKELNDQEIEIEYDRLMQLIKDKRIEIDYIQEYNTRKKYKFLMEELFYHEIPSFDMPPNMVHHFIYEDFYPNHEIFVRSMTEEFLDMWIARILDKKKDIFARTVSVGNEAVGYKHKQLSHLFRHIFDAYISFDNAEYDFKTTNYRFSSPENTSGTSPAESWAEGYIAYDATLENGEIIHFEGPFKLKMRFRHDKWSICNIILPGLV